MDPRSENATVLDPSPVPVDQFYRMSPEVYQGMIEHGLLNANANGGEKVELVDGLLVVAGSTGDPVDRLYRIPLEVYDEIAEIGLLGPSDNVEMLDGILVKQMTKGDPHRTATLLIVEALRHIVSKGWHITKEDPIALANGPSGRASEPEPDVTVVRGAIRDYSARKPTPADAALVVEVADSSLRKDREGLARYAWANIPVVWIVNLNEPAVEVYSAPSGPEESPRYQEMTAHGPDDEIPVVIDGQEVGGIAVKDILP